MGNQPNSWFERHVTESLDRIENKVDALMERELQREQRLTRVEERTTLRSSLFGAIAGFLAGLSKSMFN